MRATALLFMTIACAGGKDEPPDATYKVTVNGLDNDCTSDDSYNKSFVYQLFYDGSSTEIKIENEDGEGDGFASGLVSGCTLTYNSAIWLEERNGGDLRWQVTGEARIQGEAGGCDLPDGVDWEGTEVLEILESEDEDIEAGCQYDMEVTGKLQGG